MNVSLRKRCIALGRFLGHSAPRLNDRIVEFVRVHYDARRTEQAYLYWTRRYLGFHSDRHPCEMAQTDLNRFLTDLAGEDHASASTQDLSVCLLLRRTR